LRILKLPVNIVCVKYGTKYNKEDVLNLLEMVKKNCSLPFSFYCLSDEEIEGVSTIPLDLSLNLESYWWKICLFNLDWDVPTLYLDLDICIQNNLDHMFEYISKGALTVIRGDDMGLYYPYDGGYTIMTIPQAVLNTSIMGFYPRYHKGLYDKFMEDPETNMVMYYGLDRFVSSNHDNFNYINFKYYYHPIKCAASYDPRFVYNGFVIDLRKTFSILSQMTEKDRDYFLINKGNIEKKQEIHQCRSMKISP
jgi:hypothetical protein